VTLKNGQLLAEGEILQGERATSSERRPGCGKHSDQEREHAPIYQFQRRCANQRNAKDLARIEFWRTTTHVRKRGTAPTAARARVRPAVWCRRINR